MGKFGTGIRVIHAAKDSFAGVRRCLVRLAAWTATAAALVSAPAALAVNTVSASEMSPLRLQVASGGWGNTPSEELQVVLNAVVAEFGAQFPGRAAGTIQVVPGSAPMALFERGPQGAYVVELSARNARWHQFVYQFSHELCHIYSNYDNRDAGEAGRSHQWFEESVCEAAALFSLRRLAERWSATAPDPRLSEHAMAFVRYADYFMNEPHRQLPSTRPFAAWFRENHPALATNPYFRDRNEVVANLILPLFEREPRLWGAIAYLNSDRNAAGKSFGDFLLAWHEACPEEYRGVVREIMALFDTPATQTAGAAEMLRNAH